MGHYFSDGRNDSIKKYLVFLILIFFFFFFKGLDITRVLRWVKLSHNLCAGFVAGFWQTPFWDGVTRYLPRDRPWLELELNIPEDHSVMISFEQLGVGLEPMLRMRCPRENMVEVKVPSQPSFFERYCDNTKNTLPKLIASASKVLIAYQLTFNPLHVNTGFKLRFSFHKKPARIDFFTDTKQFNCSGQYWPQFKQHFPCNLEKDCDGGEDEAECPYMSRQRCGQNYMAVAGTCFFLERGDRLRSWSEAAKSCSRHNHHLPTLNTREEWEEFQRLLDYKKGLVPFVGLTLGLSRLPNMYVPVCVCVCVFVCVCVYVCVPV